MPSKNTPDENTVGNRAEAFGENVAARARDAKDSMSDMASNAAEKVDDGRSAAADRLTGAASAVHDRADSLPGQKVREFAHAAADRLSTTADYVRTHDASRMAEDMETMVKNNPGPALLIAAAFGFLLGRALSRD